jgi:hypothetical protein
MTLEEKCSRIETICEYFQSIKGGGERYVFNEDAFVKTYNLCIRNNITPESVFKILAKNGEKDPYLKACRKAL